MSSYTLGYDVGLKHDPSAGVLVERLVRFALRAEDRTHEATLGVSVERPVEAVYRILHVQELKHTPSDAQIDWLSELMGRPEIRDDVMLAYDSTGVGGSFGDMIAVAHREGRLGRCYWPLGASIVAGDGRPGAGLGFFGGTVKKVDLVANLRTLLEQKRIFAPVGIAGGENLLKECRAFTAKPSGTGLYTYENATASIHDDLVVATMYATYFVNWHRLPRYLGADGSANEQNATAYKGYRGH